MNTVKIWGGLGNQMFQYAFGCVSGLRTGEEIKYDLSWFYESPNRSYGLGAFNCKVEEIDGRLVRKLTRDKPLLRLFGIRPKLRKTREEPLCIYNPRLLEAKNAAFSGYYQVARYYEEADVRTKLLEDFTLKDIPERVASISREMGGGAVNRCRCMCAAVTISNCKTRMRFARRSTTKRRSNAFARVSASRVMSSSFRTILIGAANRSICPAR